MHIDWTGNKQSTFSTLEARKYAKSPRVENDYYATEPKATQVLLDVEKFSHRIWEPACGGGHMSEVLKRGGYDVVSTDLVDRGYGDAAGVDFLQQNETPVPDCDIITNPPYSFAFEFAEHAMEILEYGHKLAMFLKLQFLEGKKRKQFFMKYPPVCVYVSSSRLHCGRNGAFVKGNDAMAYAWYVWKKGFSGDTIIRWVN